MSIIGIGLNLLLAVLLCAGLTLGWRLNKRLKALRDSNDGFAIAVRELNIAAERAERGLADLKMATDEVVDLLGDRIQKGHALATRLERLVAGLPAATPTAAQPEEDRGGDRRLGALLAAAREARAQPDRPLRRDPPARPRPQVEDDLFEDPDPDPLTLIRGGRR